jgi:hypothetical protein
VEELICAMLSCREKRARINPTAKANKYFLSTAPGSVMINIYSINELFPNYYTNNGAIKMQYLA